MIKLKLPYPPSNNHYMGRTRSGKSFLTKVTKDFRAAVAELVGPSTTKNTFLAVEVTIYHPDRRKRDICNIEKCLSDALQHAGQFEDDYLIDDIRFTRARDNTSNILTSKPGCVIVSIMETTTNFNFKEVSYEDIK